MQEFKTYSFPKKKHTHGLSLIELMVALALTLIIVLSAAKGLSAISTTSMEQAAQNSAQEVATLTFNHIESSIKSTASTPCERLSAFSTSQLQWMDGVAQLNAWVAITNVGSPAPNPDPQGTLGELIPPSDTLTYYLTGERSAILNDTGLSGSDITLTNILPDTNSPALIGQTATFMITDCNQARIFNAQINFDSGGNLVLSPASAFNRDFESANSSIAMLKRVSLNLQFNNTSNEWELIENIATGFAGAIPTTTISQIALVSGIESMSLLWGLDISGTDDIVDTFANSNQLLLTPSNISDIKSINVYLLVKPQGFTNRRLSRPSNSTILFPNGNDLILANSASIVNLPAWDFTDGNLRKVFSKTISLRNGVQ